MADKETNNIPKDTPILRCWIKKSWDVSKKVGLWLGGIAVAVIAAYLAWLGLTSQTVATIWSVVTVWFGSTIACISNYIATIPPMIFWGSVGIGTAIASILGYSLAWCRPEILLMRIGEVILQRTSPLSSPPSPMTQQAVGIM